MLGQLLSPKEAAPMLGVSAWLMRQMVREGRIASVEVGHRRKIRKSDIEAYFRPSVSFPSFDSPTA